MHTSFGNKLESHTRLATQISSHTKCTSNHTRRINKAQLRVEIKKAYCTYINDFKHKERGYARIIREFLGLVPTTEFHLH